MRASSLCRRFLLVLRAVELMVPGDFFSSLMMLCYCVFIEQAAGKVFSFDLGFQNDLGFQRSTAHYMT